MAVRASESQSGSHREPDETGRDPVKAIESLREPEWKSQKVIESKREPVRVRESQREPK